MPDAALIAPVILMAGLTILMVFSLGIRRYLAIRRGEVSIKFYRTYNEGEQTPALHLLGRHVQNHFEVPPLFYAGALMALVTDSVSVAVVICAWVFVLARIVHSVIHLGHNNVRHRFAAFGVSLLGLLGLWVSWVLAYVGS